MIEFEDQGSTERVWEELKRVGGNKKHASLRLWPYMSYRFRVTAINDVGKSDPSRPSDIHNTVAEGQCYRVFCAHIFDLFKYLFEKSKHDAEPVPHHSAGPKSRRRQE